MRRILAVAALSLIALFAWGGTALAHNVLVNTDPAEGARLDTGPGEVHLTFNEPVRAGYNTVTVVGPDGSYWTDGQVRADSNVVSSPVRELGPAGTYTIGYRILSDDGHPVSGKVTFTLTNAGHGTPASAPQQADHSEQTNASSSSGMPIWPWIVGAAVFVLLGLGLSLRLGKSAQR